MPGTPKPWFISIHNGGSIDMSEVELLGASEDWVLKT